MVALFLEKQIHRKLYRLIIACSSNNETQWIDTRYILSVNVSDQLMMVIQNSCEVNREHTRICGGVLWTWLDQTV